MNLAEWLHRSARRQPGTAALFDGDRLIADYRGLAASVATLAATLVRRFGVGPGDRVALVMANRPEYLICMNAAWWLGAAVAPINYKLHAREAAWIISDCDAKVVIADEVLAHELQPLLVGDSPTTSIVTPDELLVPADASMMAPVRRESGDLAWLFYTSGTTGRPKGVMLSNGNLMAMSLAYLSDVDGVGAEDASLYAAPFSHGAGLYSLVHTLRGARHIVPRSGGFDAAETLELAASLRNVSMFAAPTMVRRLVDAARPQRAPGDGIKTVVYGGGPMYVSDIIDATTVMGPRFVQIYGQGESPMTITTLSRERVADRRHPRWRERLASVGVPHCCVEVQIATEQGEPVGAGEVGEIWVKGATVMQGYWKRPDATNEALRHGWLRTGDMGVVDDDGFLTLKDRSKDVIISGGSNIYPREVEEVLLTHPAVHECSVIGRIDPEWGEVVVAFVSPVPGTELDPGQLDALCLEQIARFKRPKEYRLVDELPKNSYGKILKTHLRDQLKGGSS